MPSCVWSRSLAGARLTAALLLVLGSVAAGCASGTVEDAGPPPRDGGPDVRIDAPTDAAPPLDLGMPDVPERDAGPPCGGMICTGFTRCVDDACVDYPPCRGDGTCPDPGDVCTARHCVPGTADPDGDGSPARDDCDETDPTRSPLLPEVCNARDDNCNGAADEGDPATMCSLLSMGGLCMGGSCSCPMGTFDFDLAVPGCECTGSPGVGEGATCASPVDLGDIADTGQMQVISGNALNGEVWYRFRAFDSPDSACDNMHVRVQLLENPGGAYEMEVRRSACDLVSCTGTPVVDYSWATDFRADIGGVLTGQCPCTPAGGARVNNVSVCEDDTTQFFIRVRRADGSTPACTPFRIEVSNGLYDT